MTPPANGEASARATWAAAKIAAAFSRETFGGAYSPDRVDATGLARAIDRLSAGGRFSFGYDQQGGWWGAVWRSGEFDRRASELIAPALLPFLPPPGSARNGPYPENKFTIVIDPAGSSEMRTVRYVDGTGVEEREPFTGAGHTPLGD